MEDSTTAHILIWLSSFKDQLWALYSGLAITAIMGLFNWFFMNRNKKSLFWRFEIYMITVLVIISSFLVWEDLYLKVVPVLEIQFQGKIEPFFVESDDHNVQLYRIQIKNTGIRVINNVQVQLISIKSDSESNILPVPLNLHFKDDNKTDPKDKYKTSIDLANNYDQFIGIVQYREEKNDKKVMRIKHIAEGIQNEIPIGKYIVVIKATGNDVNYVIKKYEIGTENDNLFMRPIDDPVSN